MQSLAKCTGGSHADRAAARRRISGRRAVEESRRTPSTVRRRCPVGRGVFSFAGSREDREPLKFRLVALAGGTQTRRRSTVDAATLYG